MHGPRAPVRVAIVEDHEIFGDALAFFLERQPQVHLVGVARDGASAIQLAVDAELDVVLMDVTLPDIDGFEAAQRLLERRPGCRILAMTAWGEDDLQGRLETSGMVGYLSKDHIYETVLDAVLDALPPGASADA
jgi:DNA-binding NarL/FixJ family response regulator